MARRTTKTMAQKMAESGRAPGKDVLDDTDLADDPIISALQTLRLTIDDLQNNDNDNGISTLKSAVTANTAKNTNVTTNLSTTTSTTTVRVNSSDGTNATLPVATTSIGGVMSKAIFDQHTANNAKPTQAVAKNLSNTTEIGDVKVDVKMTVALSRGAYSLTFTLTHGETTKTATVALR